MNRNETPYSTMGSHATFTGLINSLQ